MLVFIVQDEKGKMSFHPGDMVRLNEFSSAYASKNLESARLQGIVIKARKREMHQEKGRLGRRTEIAVVDMVEVMWSDGSVQKLDGRYLEKITTRDSLKDNDDE